MHHEGHQLVTELVGTQVPLGQSQPGTRCTPRGATAGHRTTWDWAPNNLSQARVSMVCSMRVDSWCGGCHPGYQHGGPIQPLGQRVGRADYSRRDTHGPLAAQDFKKLLAE